MSINRKATSFFVCLSLATNISILAHSQAAGISPDGGSLAVQTVGEAQAPPQVVTQIDEARLVRLHGNTHPNARTEFDKGLVDPQLPMENMILVLKRSPEKEAALEAFMARQLDPQSADFHHWLQPEDLGRIYGPSDADIASVTNWLQNQGFSIGKVANARTFIEFTGTARLVQKAFHTEIHRYNVRGEEHIANNTDPSIPEALSPVVAGVLSLHNFFTQPLHTNLGSFHRVGNAGKWEPDNPDVLLKPMFNVGSGFEWVAPYDFATIPSGKPESTEPARRSLSQDAATLTCPTLHLSAPLSDYPQVCQRLSRMALTPASRRLGTA